MYIYLATIHLSILGLATYMFFSILLQLRNLHHHIYRFSRHSEVITSVIFAHNEITELLQLKTETNFACPIVPPLTTLLDYFGVFKVPPGH